MHTPIRFLLAALLLAPALAPAQTTTTTTTVIGVPPSLQVQRLGPQLVTFVGGQANFDNLVNGLSLGTPVTLITPLPNGQQQLVTFTPQGTLTPIQIAQTLETARQSLISRGVAAPTAQQVAITLTGGALPTQTGTVQVTALLPTVPTTNTAAAGGTTPSTTLTTPDVNGTPSPSAIIQGQTSAGTTPPSPAQIIQNQRDGNVSNTPSATGTTAGTTPSTGTSSTIAPTTVTPTAPVTPTTAPAASAPASASIRTR